MKALLDTHAFLWAFLSPHKLSDVAYQAIVNPETELFLSVVSYWEICLKQSRGKLKLNEGWEDQFRQKMEEHNISWLGVKPTHCLGIVDLPDIHRDPFDRLLIAQALHENFVIITIDEHIRRYTVLTLW